VQAARQRCPTASYDLPIIMTNALPTEPERVPVASTSSVPARSEAGSGIPYAPAADDSSGRIGTLRGASVGFNPRRLVQVVVALLMATLVVTVIVLTLAGIHSNNQINRLHGQGQPVTVHVTSCFGLLGGSGSNAAGYSCRGTYTLDGNTFNEALPGSTLYRPGTKLPAVAVPGDPALVSPTAIISTQRASNGVFIVPIILGIILLMLVVIVVVRTQPRQHKASVAPHASAV
jgi:hypothetical protein